MNEDVIVAIVLVVFIGGIIVIGLVSNYRKTHKTCPKCGKRNSLTVTGTEEVPKGGNNMIFFRTDTWTCSKCGHQEQVKTTVNYGTRSSAAMSRKKEPREIYEE